MIKIENVKVTGWDQAIQSIHIPRNNLVESDSGICKGGDDGIGCQNCANCDCCDHTFDYSWQLGKVDHALMIKLAAGNYSHIKYRRMIVVYLDITAPLYWWKEFDGYYGIQSCSAICKNSDKAFSIKDFSHEHLFDGVASGNIVKDPFSEGETMLVNPRYVTYLRGLNAVIDLLNDARELYLETGDKEYWWQIIQLLPASYNQRRTVILNYEVLAGIYPTRKNHKLDEWRELCRWIEGLPYSEIIIGGETVELFADGRKIMEVN